MKYDKIDADASDCALQFVMPTLQVAAFTIAESGQQNDYPRVAEVWHKRCFKLS